MVVSAGVAHAEVRSLSLINVHTQERASVVFKRDGVYDQNGLQELNRLLRDWRRNEVTRMDPALFDLIWEVYRDTGAHDPINVVCGYRSPATNNMLRERSRGVARYSQHMLGKAMDFYLPDVPLSRVREVGMKKQVGGVGFYPTSGSPFVHMDTGSVRAWPRMTREQLVRLFPDGHTAHLPADGRPLAGYESARAESEARKTHGGAPVETASSSSGGGLLAALFGGSSSSRSNVVAGEDEEEASATPVRRGRELRQGPLPAPAVRVADKGETPPGVSLGPSVPAQTQRPVQMAAAQPVPPPPPIPTTVARGSLVPMPVANPQIPARQQTAAAIPSRYAPATADGLPPGWVRGPSGRPATTAEASPTPVAAAAAAPVLARIDVPTPSPRPGSERAILAYAATPIDVALPRPRPTGAQRVADLGAAPVPTPRGDATAAIAMLTGEEMPAAAALGYAPTAEATRPAAPATTATIDPGARFGAISAPVERRDLAALTSAPAAQPIPSRLVAKTDRGGAPAKPVAKTDRSGESRLLDASSKAEGRDFALLRHPDQGRLDGLMTVPREALAGGFVTASLASPAPAVFSGPAVVALPIVPID
jgi:uncharacterized protein YcbK (DUF882 family)